MRLVDVLELQEHVDAGTGDKAGGDESCERNQGVQHACLLVRYRFIDYTIPTGRGSCDPSGNFRACAVFAQRGRDQVFLNSLREYRSSSERSLCAARWSDIS